MREIRCNLQLADNIYAGNECFILQIRFNPDRTYTKHLCVMGIQFENIFGALQHYTTANAFRANRIGDAFRNLIIDAYGNCYMGILTEDGLRREEREAEK
ncbi:hypothetical protein CDAR_486871 [Caerostris darwini]|uniref:Uncharacterized protein n=1 Tax=Caerostris darwini TaxID=1538125 RepID=A0AAV4R684_9ARAC|nr:hypothetical protein CDAR_486871 [Caerostris darwini]